jgi:hypothetical protein
MKMDRKYLVGQLDVKYKAVGKVDDKYKVGKGIRGSKFNVLRI